MVARSAGLLVYRRGGSGSLEVLVVHPGGPFWAKKHAGAWSIPKGEYVDGDDPHAAAVREFAEELGSAAPIGDEIDLGEVRLKSGKRIVAWAVEGDLDVSTVVSNTFEMQWPPRSGRLQSFPEVDRAEWCSPDEARLRLNAAQVPLLDELLRRLGLDRT